MRLPQQQCSNEVVHIPGLLVTMQVPAISFPYMPTPLLSAEKDVLVNQVAELQRVCEALLLSQMQVGSWIARQQNRRAHSAFCKVHRGNSILLLVLEPVETTYVIVSTRGALPKMKTSPGAAAV